MHFQENEQTELKERYTEDIRKEVIAFANCNGGIIYIGVNDEGNVVGIDNPDDVSLKISNSCRDAIKPDVTMFLSYEMIVIENKTVIALRVQRGTGRPYYLGAKGLKPAGVFVRQGNSSAPATEVAIRQMIKESDGDRFEDMRSLNQNLTFEEVQRVFGARGLELQEVQMQTLGLLNGDHMFTNLALLLSDQCPHIIKGATFRGDDQEKFQDRREFTGSLLKQLDDAYAYLDLRNQTTATFKGLYRTDTKDYPDAALREALLNAIVHRDYGFSASTLISVYANRVEFVSYGGLAGGVSLTDVMNGLSVCRNPKLANIFYRLTLIEAYGTGLKKMQNAYAGLGMRPEFMVGPMSFKVVLPNMNTVDDFGVSEPSVPYAVSRKPDKEIRKALDYFASHGEVSRSELEAYMGISTSGAVRLLKQLRDKGCIEANGKGKNTRYTMIL